MKKSIEQQIEEASNSDDIIRDTYWDSAYTAKNAFLKGASLGVKLGFEQAIELLKNDRDDSVIFLFEEGLRLGILTKEDEEREK